MDASDFAHDMSKLGVFVCFADVLTLSPCQLHTFHHSHLPLDTPDLVISTESTFMGALRENTAANVGDVCVVIFVETQPSLQDPLTRRSNPFISKVAMSPSSKRSISPADDRLTLLREGMARMDVATRNGSAELNNLVTKELTSGASGRDVSKLSPK
jgi:hypothetical protein